MQQENDSRPLTNLLECSFELGEGVHSADKGGIASLGNRVDRYVSQSVQNLGSGRALIRVQLQHVVA